MPQTALIITVPEADPLVGAWRRLYDPRERDGVPAHVTVLYPFLEPDRIDEATIAALRALFASHDAFDLAFRRCARLSGMVCLAPEPDLPLRALTAAVAARWPEAPPYRGRFEDPVPHLTVALGQEETVNQKVEADLAARLPLLTRVDSVRLVVRESGVWRGWTSFALRQDRSPGAVTVP
ncbi:2'-5' RNA ligase family protein [Streptacidiphilus carbonis]|uniref:2'-5' RNA ligase family protein n=1 Tax=Streptacidiphilus carbonis TaxID=105422 RepID=UPI001F21D494|nr:2'-5' RNA ligase family protein [Streptacidiphilus carbonis]